MGNPATMFTTPLLNGGGFMFDLFGAIIFTVLIFGCLGAFTLGLLYLWDPHGFKEAQVETKRKQAAETAWLEKQVSEKEEFIKNYKID